MSKWIKANDDGIGTLGDVDVTTTAPQAGDLLEFDGTDWVPAPKVAGSAGFFGSFTVSNTSADSAATLRHLNLGTYTAASVTAMRFDTVNKDDEDQQTQLQAVLGIGAIILLRQGSDYATFQATGPATIPPATTETRVDVSPIQSTQTTLGGDYEVTILPAKSIAVIAGSASITLTGSEAFQTKSSWPNGTSWQNWAWDEALGTASPTTVLYDHTGILMPSDGVILSCLIQACAQDGTSWQFKPEITRIRRTPNSTTVSNTSMVNGSFTGLPTADSNMEEFRIHPGGTVADQLTTADFNQGDKLLLTLATFVNTNNVTSVKVEWAFEVAYF